MAYLQIGFFSNSLRRRAQMTVILPVDKAANEPWPDHDGKPYKTLYLLHGIFGDNLSWPSFSRIQRYAEARNLVVVMPSGENGFYLDHPDTYNCYATLVGEEIVALTRRMFPLSHKREDTFLGGFSMGGYGALRNGLKYSDTFGAIVAFSSALLLEEYKTKTVTNSPIDDWAYAEAMFGDPETVLESDRNPAWLAKQILSAGKELPAIYMSCGEQDSLLPKSQQLVDILRGMGAEVTYETAPGGHDWDFWDAQINHVIEDWLPVEPPLEDQSKQILAH